MNSKLKLEILKKVRERKGAAQGFTLVELMIVVAVIGILSAVALPQYLKARAAAEAGAKLGEIIGQAKECATSVAAGGIGLPPSPCTTSGGTYTASWSQSVENLRCLSTSSVTGQNASIVVSSTGGLSCSIS